MNYGGTLLTGNNASENAIMNLNNNHELKKYKIIHLATHGIVVPDIPELSALVLSQVENESYDGYLSMQ